MYNRLNRSGPAGADEAANPKNVLDMIYLI